MIVAGQHRLEAAKSILWTEIDAFIMESDDSRDFELWRIAENLLRAKLSQKERNKLVARWAELVGEEGVLVQAGPEPKGGRPKGGIREAARKLGLSHQDIIRAQKTASLSPEAEDASVALGLDDNQSALLEAAKMKTPEEQVAVLEKLAEKKAEKKIPKAKQPPAQAVYAADVVTMGGVGGRR